MPVHLVKQNKINNNNGNHATLTPVASRIFYRSLILKPMTTHISPLLNTARDCCWPPLYIPNTQMFLKNSKNVATSAVISEESVCSERRSSRFLPTDLTLD